LQRILYQTRILLDLKNQTKFQNERAGKTKIYQTIQEEEAILIIKNTNLTIQNWREKTRSKLGFFIGEFIENESAIESKHDSVHDFFKKKWCTNFILFYFEKNGFYLIVKVATYLQECHY
jgi:hypothetical protein